MKELEHFLVTVTRVSVNQVSVSFMCLFKAAITANDYCSIPCASGFLCLMCQYVQYVKLLLLQHSFWYHMLPKMMDVHQNITMKLHFHLFEKDILFSVLVLCFLRLMLW